jgi:hypothetical protein
MTAPGQKRRIAQTSHVQRCPLRPFATKSSRRNDGPQAALPPSMLPGCRGDRLGPRPLDKAASMSPDPPDRYPSIGRVDLTGLVGARATDKMNAPASHRCRA